MKKTNIIIGAVVVVLIAGFAFFKLKGNSLDKTIEKVKDYKQYELSCDMEMVQNDELKSYVVNVSYLSKDKQDYYKVELYDKSLNQSQIIIRNKEGVFVLTPTLNQVFKFQSDWPTNSPKPYIYTSLISLLEKNDAEKTKDGYKVLAKVTYPNDSRIVNQEITFNKDLVPQTVICYDKDEAEIITTKFNEFKTKTSLSTKDFNQDEVLKKAQNDYQTSADASVLYPVALMGSTLDSETVSTVDGSKNHILKFTGDKNFTVIESAISNQDVSVSQIDDEVIEMVDGFAYYSDGKLMMTNAGMMCSIYSRDLTKEEMISVMTSMQTSSTK